MRMIQTLHSMNHYSIQNVSILRAAVLIALLISLAPRQGWCDPNGIHSLGFSATAYAYRQERIAAPQALDMARDRAMSFALEKSRDYMESTGIDPETYEFLPDSDGRFIRLLTEDEITSGLPGENMVGIRIIGQAFFRLKDHAGENTSRPLSVVLSSNSKKYAQGDEIVFSLQGNKGFYACMVDLNPEGDIIQLLPNRLKKIGYFDGRGKTFFPNKDLGDTFRLIVDKPFGTEKILLFAGTMPFEPLIAAKEYSGVFGTTRESLAQVKSRLLANIVLTLRQTDPRDTFKCYEFYQTEIEFTTAEK